MLTAEPVTVVNDFELSLGLDVISVSYKSLISWLLHSGKQLEWCQADK